MHTLDASIDSLTFSAPPHAHTPPGGFEEGLESGQSRYKAYLMWLGWCGLMCGWEWEKEPLRVPSTRGWGIVGESETVAGGADVQRGSGGRVETTTESVGSGRLCRSRG
jgi:tRNASer (uridine44-2'-O)-methyltransferase